MLRVLWRGRLTITRKYCLLNGMSKTFLSLTIVISFIGIAVFGFTAIGTPGCIAQLSNGGICLAHASAWEQAAFYLSTFQSFSNGVLQLALTLLAAVVVLRLGALLVYQQYVMVSLVQYRRFIATTVLPIKQKLLKFLALYQCIHPIPVRL